MFRTKSDAVFNDVSSGRKLIAIGDVMRVKIIRSPAKLTPITVAFKNRGSKLIPDLFFERTHFKSRASIARAAMRNP